MLLLLFSSLVNPFVDDSHSRLFCSLHPVAAPPPPLHLAREGSSSRAHLHLLYGLVIARCSICLVASSLPFSATVIFFALPSLLYLLRDTTWSLFGTSHGKSTKRYVPPATNLISTRARLSCPIAYQDIFANHIHAFRYICWLKSLRPGRLLPLKCCTASFATIRSANPDGTRFLSLMVCCLFRTPSLDRVAAAACSPRFWTLARFQCC